MLSLADVAPPPLIESDASFAIAGGLLAIAAVAAIVVVRRRRPDADR